MLTLGNIAWWKVRMPDRNDDGDIVLVDVRLKFRLFTRLELRERKVQRLQQGVSGLCEALDNVSKASAPDEMRAAAEQMQAATNAFLAGEADDDADLMARILDWRPEDIAGEPFSAELLSALLSDEARFRACLQALEDASHGAYAKN